MTMAKVIIVEDEHIVAKDFETRIKDMGYTVCANVPSGMEAIEQAQIHQPDLVLMDVVLRGELDGIEAAGTIRSRWNIPVIFITSYSDEPTLERAKLTEPFGYLVKPFKDSEIKAVIEMALYKSQVEARLRKSEQRFHNLVETSNDWIWEVDQSGVFTYVSPQVRELLGYEPNEVLGKTAFDFMPPEEAERVGAYYREVAESRRAIRSFESLNRHKDGRVLIFETNGVPILDENEQIVGYRGIDRDITNQRRQEHELRILYRAVTQSPAAVIITDLKGNIDYVNPKFTQLTGYSLEEANRQATHILTSSPQSPEFYQDIWSAISSGGDWRGEIQYRKKSGEPSWWHASISPIKNDTGQITHYLAVMEEITPRKQAEEKIKRSKELVDTILNSLAEPISLIDVDTYKVIEANQAFLAKIGLSEPAPTDMTCYEITHRFPKPCQHYGLECPMLDTLKTGRQSMAEHLHFDETGRETHLEINTFPVKDETGRIIQVVRVEHDITLHQQTKEALQKAKETAEAISRAKSEFLANISHELRTPLNPIIGVTDLVLDTKLDNEQRELLDLARSAATKLLAMIDDLLELSRLEAENIRLDKYTLDVAMLVESALKNRADEVEQKGLKLTRHIEPDVPREIIGDPYYLLQILNRILENAVKFTEKGEISVAVAKGPDEGDTVVLHFSVTDTGIGIPAHRLDDLYQDFTQADASMSRKFGGLGIGLTMVRRLVELMGGHFRAESIEGEGSTFYFTLPFHPAQDA